MPRRIAGIAPKLWCALVLGGLKFIAGLNYEIRGRIPADGALIAAKHMSMLDAVLLYYVLNDAVFVIKRELLFVPVWGWFASKMQMIAIDREAGASALRKMTAAASASLSEGRALVIYPEGTRRKPGAAPAYKPGIAAVYGQLGRPCVPVALNSGQFWTGFVKKQGTVVVEFLAPIAPGLKRADFMAELQARIETATAALVAEGRAQLARK
jgi:1-acyl-sn-glycerol-3-phosphate acyltransferase